MEKKLPPPEKIMQIQDLIDKLFPEGRYILIIATDPQQSLGNLASNEDFFKVIKVLKTIAGEMESGRGMMNPPGAN